eukprot:scaffold131062_cov27-Tisochrysis_lutea.AAC.2
MDDAMCKRKLANGGERTLTPSVMLRSYIAQRWVGGCRRSRVGCQDWLYRSSMKGKQLTYS